MLCDLWEGASEVIRRAQFIVEVRFKAETRWRKHQSHSNLVDAMTHATEISVLRVDQWTYAFPNVRVRYRGLTLALWREGGYIR